MLVNHKPGQPAGQPTLKWALPFLAILYLLTRLVLLTRLPVFLDEAILAERARQVLAGEFPGVLAFGKGVPTIIAALFSLLPTSELFRLRLASALAGLVTLFSCVSAGRELFGERDGLLAGFIYTILPYSLFYERLALADVYVAAFAAWSLYLSLVLVRSPRWKFRLLLCAACSASVLSKPTGAVCLVVPLLACVLLVERGKRAAYWRSVLPAVTLGAVGLAVQSTLGQSNQWIAEKGIYDIAALPAIVLRNLADARIWYGALLTPALGVLSAAAIIVWAVASFRKPARAELFLIMVLALSVTPYLIFARILFSRYLLFSITPLTLLLARTASFGASLLSRWSFGRRRVLKVSATIGSLAVLAWPCLVLDFAILNEPESAALPYAVRDEFITGWPSGYGMPELKQFLEEQAQSQPINVLRFDTLAPTKLSLNVYLASSARLHLAQVSPYKQDAIAQTIEQFAWCRRTLFVSDPGRELKDGVVAIEYLGKATLIWVHPRPTAHTKLQVWEIAQPPSLPPPDAVPQTCE
jgi:hypothetical protein